MAKWFHSPKNIHETIGKTKTGKEVKAAFGHPGHADFSHEDHSEAAAHHRGRAADLVELRNALAKDPDAPIGQDAVQFKMKQFARRHNHHVIQAELHDDQARLHRIAIHLKNDPQKADLAPRMKEVVGQFIDPENFGEHTPKPRDPQPQPELPKSFAPSADVVLGSDQEWKQHLSAPKSSLKKKAESLGEELDRKRYGTKTPGWREFAGQKGKDSAPESLFESFPEHYRTAFSSLYYPDDMTVNALHSWHDGSADYHKGLQHLLKTGQLDTHISETQGQLDKSHYTLYRGIKGTDAASIRRKLAQKKGPITVKLNQSNPDKELHSFTEDPTVASDFANKWGPMRTESTKKDGLVIALKVPAKSIVHSHHHQFDINTLGDYDEGLDWSHQKEHVVHHPEGVVTINPEDVFDVEAATKRSGAPNVSQWAKKAKGGKLSKAEAPASEFYWPTFVERHLISPEGKHVKLGSGEEHTDTLVRLTNHRTREAHQKGWLEVGKGGEPAVVGHPDILNDPTHPATQALAQRVRDFPPDKEFVSVWHNLKDTNDWFKVPRKHAEKGNFKPASQTQMFRSEKMAKEMWGSNNERMDQMEPFHGWIAPDGKFHRMPAEYTHDREIEDHLGQDVIEAAKESGEIDDTHTASDLARSRGWISIGHAGDPNAVGHAQYIHDPTHPATQTLARMVRDLHPDLKKERFMVETDTDRVYELPHRSAELGNFRKPSAVQMFRSEDYTTDIWDESEPLEKAYSPIGPKYVDPTGQTEAHYHAGIGQWSKRYSQKIRDATDNFVGLTRDHFLNKSFPNEKHRNLVARLFKMVGNNPYRHHIISVDNRGGSQVPRQRHLEQLILGRNAARIVPKGDDEIHFEINRHGPGGERHAWSFNSAGQFKFLGNRPPEPVSTMPVSLPSLRRKYLLDNNLGGGAIVERKGPLGKSEENNVARDLRLVRRLAKGTSRRVDGRDLRKGSDGIVAGGGTVPSLRVRLERHLGTPRSGRVQDLVRNRRLEKAQIADWLDALAGTIAQVASVAIFNSVGAILMGRRKDSGRWTLPGGHFDPKQETPDAAVHRELKEEANFDVGHLKSLGSMEIVNEEGKDIEVHAFSGTADAVSSPHADPDDEVSKWEWIEVKEGKLPEAILDNLHSRQNVVLKILKLQDWSELSKTQGLIAFPKLGVARVTQQAQIVDPEGFVRKQKIFLGGSKGRESAEGNLAGRFLTRHSGVGTEVRTPYNQRGGMGLVNAGVRKTPKDQLGTQMHEEQHGLFHDVGEEHGIANRVRLARHLISKIPHPYNLIFQKMTDLAPSVRGLPKGHPMEHEERITFLHNYLNNPAVRKQLHGHWKGVDPNHNEREVDRALKVAFRSMRDTAKGVELSHLADPVQKAESDLPYGHEQKAHPATKKHGIGKLLPENETILDPGPPNWKPGRLSTTRVDSHVMVPVSMLRDPEILTDTPIRTGAYPASMRSQEELDELEGSVKQHGFSEKGARYYRVCVAVHGDGKINVIDGTHRAYIAHKLGIKEIPAEVRYFARSDLDHGLLHEDKVEKSIKKLALGAVLGAATALAPTPMGGSNIPLRNLHEMNQTVDKYPEFKKLGDHKYDQFLDAIAGVESSGGRDLAHRVNTHGLHKGFAAVGPQALMPLTVKQTARTAKTPEVRALAGLDPKDIVEKLNKDPKLYREVARAHANVLAKRFNENPVLMAHAWNQGPNKKVDVQTASDHPYVQKFMEHYHAPVKKAETYGYDPANPLKDEIPRLLGHKDWNIRRTVFDTLHAKHITPEHIAQGLKDEDSHVRLAAIQHPNVTPQQLTDALAENEPFQASAAAQHPNLTPEHLTQILTTGAKDIGFLAVQHPKATEEHLDLAMKSDEYRTKEQVLRSPKSTRKHVEQGLKDPYWSVRAAALRHPLATDEDHTAALEDEDKTVRGVAEDAYKLSHPDKFHKESVNVNQGSEIYRKYRTSVNEAGGAIHKKDFKQHGINEQHVSKLLDHKGNLTEEKLGQHIDSLPGQKYNVSHGYWEAEPNDEAAWQMHNEYVDSHRENAAEDFRDYTKEHRRDAKDEYEEFVDGKHGHYYDVHNHPTIAKQYKKDFEEDQGVSAEEDPDAYHEWARGKYDNEYGSPPDFDQWYTDQGGEPDFDNYLENVNPPMNFNDWYENQINEGVDMPTNYADKQMHSPESQKVLQLNLTDDHVKKMKEAGVYGTFQKVHEQSTYGGHPVTPSTIGWVRYNESEDSPNDIHIDEIQTDLGRSIIKQAKTQAKQALQAGQITDAQAQEAVRRAEQKYPDGHLDKIRDILFGNQHPETALHEAFHQHFRDKGDAGSKIHINSGRLKGQIAGMSEGKDLPVHIQETYDKRPPKLGYEKSTFGYGQSTVQPSSEYQGKPTWQTELHKKEDLKLLEHLLETRLPKSKLPVKMKEAAKGQMRPSVSDPEGKSRLKEKLKSLFKDEEHRIDIHQLIEEIEAREGEISRDKDFDRAIKQAWAGEIPMEFEAARFMAGAPMASDEAINNSQHLFDDMEEAALHCYGIPITDETKKELRVTVSILMANQVTQKSDHGRLQPVPEMGEEIVAGANRGIELGKVTLLSRPGKFTKKALMVFDPTTDAKFIIKTDPHKHITAKGFTHTVSQPVREMAFYRLASLLGLDEHFCGVGLATDAKGEDVAIIHMLPNKFKNFDDKRKEAHFLERAILNKYLVKGIIHRWAVLDYIGGNPDRHAANMMCNDDGEIYLIDHGSCLANDKFNPAEDEKAFLPFYLRAWGAKHRMLPEDRMRLMPTTDREVAESIREWVLTLNEQDIYDTLADFDSGIAQACVDRLKRVKAILSVSKEPVVDINKIWAKGIED